MAMHPQQLVPEPKALYYAGLALAGVGLVSVVSAFISGAANFGAFENFAGPTQSEILRLVAGIALMVAGGFLMRSKT
jgi:hypothetical protein